MAEEDLIFGKNRHMFGGIEPSNMRSFSVIAKTTVVKLLATLPNDTVVDGQTLCTVAGAVIRRRIDKYPVDEFDGDLVADISASGTVSDSTADLSTPYYYSAFPYTTQGVYNRNPANRIKYKPTASYYIYGYDLDTNNSDPDARVTYPSDVDNELFEPAKMNFTGTTAEGTFSYGNWPSTAGEGFMPRPCILSSDASILGYLNPNDYTKYVDGRSAPYDDTSNNERLNVMMEWPKIYTKRELVKGIYKFRCAPVKIDDSWECWCNYNKNNVEIDHFYTSVYKRGIVSADGAFRLRSCGTTYYSASVNDTASKIREYAQNNSGSGWDIEVLSDHLLIQDLLVMMAKTTDLKSAYGAGWSNTDNQRPGGLETKGLFYGLPPAAGDSSKRTGRVKVFGMVDYWDSNLTRRLSGWVSAQGVQKVKITAGTKDGSTATDYNQTGEGYLTIPDAYARSSGYISACRVEPYGRIPIGYTGSETTYECDYFIGKQEATATYFALIAGEEYGATGPFHVGLGTEPTYTSSGIGAAVSYKPV